MKAKMRQMFEVSKQTLRIRRDLELEKLIMFWSDSKVCDKVANKWYYAPVAFFLYYYCSSFDARVETL